MQYSNDKYKLIRLPQVLEMIPMCKSAWYQGVKGGHYPKPVKIGMRMSAWRLSDIQKLIDTGISIDKASCE